MRATTLLGWPAPGIRLIDHIAHHRLLLKQPNLKPQPHAALPHCLELPNSAGSWEACPSFARYINSGGPGDHFEGFELKYRVCDPIGGKGMAIAVAADIGKVWVHFAPWIEGFGTHFDVTPVVSDAEFAAMWPGVQASAASA